MADDRPRVTRIDRNHHLDRARWAESVPENGDVIVLTSRKAAKARVLPDDRARWRQQGRSVD